MDDLNRPARERERPVPEEAGFLGAATFAGARDDGLGADAAGRPGAGLPERGVLPETEVTLRYILVARRSGAGVLCEEAGALYEGARAA
jgi:hypothetical protein